MVNRTPNIRDVAREAGVSTTTVSHVLSGRRPVAASTKDRVLAAAARLAYAPDTHARTLATGKSSIIALDLELGLVGDGVLLNPYFSTVLSTLSEAAVTYGFTFRLLPADAPIAATILSPTVSAAVVVDPTTENQWIPHLVDEGIRVVSIGRYPRPLKTSWVDNDHPQGLREAMNHLNGEGYRRIALITATQRSALMIDLEDTFRAELRERQYRGKIVLADDLTEATAYDLTQRLLSSPAKPDAIIGAIDRVAVGVLRAAADIGVSVPEDLGVVGLGDTMLAERTNPALTSIRSTPKELGEEAMGLVWKSWLDPSLPDEHVLLPAELVIRESTLRSAGIRPVDNGSGDSPE